jgi:hypothetical protein
VKGGRPFGAVEHDTTAANDEHLSSFRDQDRLRFATPPLVP